MGKRKSLSDWKFRAKPLSGEKTVRALFTSDNEWDLTVLTGKPGLSCVSNGLAIRQSSPNWRRKCLFIPSDNVNSTKCFYS
jgi:hypothetical protein